MRVIAGSLRRRVLEAPSGLATRPTSDRLRETLFNVLAPSIMGASFLDLYAGSGAVGIEALSRGAARVVFVERAQPALKVLKSNLEKIGLRSGFRVESASVMAYLRREHSDRESSFNVVFLDPPYDAADEYDGVLEFLGGSSCRLLEGETIVIAEHRRKLRLEQCYGALERTRLLEQGDAALSFYRIQTAEQEQTAAVR